MTADTYDSTMYLWEKVHNTPPEYQKSFDRGGFKGTAIDPTYLVMKATELWGPIGGDWGYEIVEDAYIQGQPILFTLADGTQQILGHHIIHKIHLRLTYPITNEVGAQIAVGHVEQYGQTTFVGSNKNGLFTDEEHAKKSLTDALSKCLSLLGFGADVRIGAFEDSVYAQQQSAAASEKEPPAEPAAITPEQMTEITKRLKAMKRNWIALATVCSTQLKREVKEMSDLTSDEAVKVLAFLEGKVAQ